jgi:hypothetical protein
LIDDEVRQSILEDDIKIEESQRASLLPPVVMVQEEVVDQVEQVEAVAQVVEMECEAVDQTVIVEEPQQVELA